MRDLLAEDNTLAYIRGHEVKSAPTTSEARVSGEAPQALPVEGVLNPIKPPPPKGGGFNKPNVWRV